MSVPYLDVCMQLAEWIQADVPDAAGWEFSFFEPLTMDATPGCAIWWTGDTPRPAGSTMITTVTGNKQGGWMDLIDTYSIMYWERVEDAGRLVLDDVTLTRVQDTLDLVRGVVFNHAIDLPGDSVNMRYQGARPFNQGLAEALVCGFRITLITDKPIAYT